MSTEEILSPGVHISRAVMAGLMGAVGTVVLSFVMGDIAFVFGFILLLTVIGQFAKAGTAWRHQIRQREQIANAYQCSGEQGPLEADAWADGHEMADAGLFCGKGLFLGTVGNRKIFYNGGLSVLTIAKAGAGKSRRMAIPTLLSYRQGAVIVTDIKGELAAMTADPREAMGQTVLILNPWEEHGLRNDTLNPLSILKDGPELESDADMIVQALIPQGNAGDESWRIDARTLIAAFMLGLYTKIFAGPCTLAQIRKMLNAGPDEFAGYLATLATSKVCHGLLAEYGGKLSTIFQTAPKQFAGGLGLAQNALKIFQRHGNLGSSTCDGALSIDDLVKSNVTTYIILPGRHMEEYATWLRLIITLTTEAVTRRPNKKQKVLFLLDEFANLGRVPNIKKALGAYRGEGFQAWIMVQGLNQLVEAYGSDAAQTFVGQTDVKQIFGVGDKSTLELAQGGLGQVSFMSTSSSLQMPRMGGSDEVGISQSISEHAKPMLRPEEIIRLPRDQQLIFYGEHRPILAHTMDYTQDQVWREQADPHPDDR